MANVDLAHTAVIPQPWMPFRMSKALQNIGHGADCGPWKNTEQLSAIAWLPWPIVWVDNGNHSTMAGILTSGGKLQAKKSFDAKELLLQVYTDGENWLKVSDNQIISPVKSLPMAAIFEVGRRLINS